MKALALIALTLWAACAIDAKTRGECDGTIATATLLATVAELVWVLAA